MSDLQLFIVDFEIRLQGVVIIGTKRIHSGYTEARIKEFVESSVPLDLERIGIEYETANDRVRSNCRVTGIRIDK